MDTKRICLDLDGVIAQIKKTDEDYADVLPIPGAIDKINMLKNAGHYVIIHTARHMKTCNGNVGMVQARLAKKTLDWLEKYEIPFDEIYFGKPWADIYIDDNAFRFENWNDISDDGSSLPMNCEKRLKGK